MRYLAGRNPVPLARAAAALGVDTAEMPSELAAQRAADAVADLIHALGLPEHLGPYGLSEADLEAAAGPVASDVYPLEDLVAIYRAAE
jgi:alcohol dehydrogenase class IV